LANTEPRWNKISTILSALMVISLATIIVALIASYLIDTPIPSTFATPFMIVMSNAGIAHSLIKSKPRADKYEVFLTSVIMAITSFLLIILLTKIFLNQTIILLCIPTIIALGLILVAYHVDRENQWKKDQQTLTPLMLQN
jgi:hypothetical protein